MNPKTITSPPQRTPPHVFDAMQLVAKHCASTGYVGVYIGNNGGAVFYRDCPVKRTQDLLSQLAEQSDDKPCRHPANLRTPGPRIPASYGSWPTEICWGCASYRILAPPPPCKWQKGPPPMTRENRE